MVGICQCHIPTPIHYDIFPPGGNMTGGNLLGNPAMQWNVKTLTDHRKSKKAHRL